MVVGDSGYQYRLSRLAYAFKGSVSMEYIQACDCRRISELTDHANRIAEDLKDG